MDERTAPRGPARWALLAALAAAYFGTAKLGLSMAFLAEQVSPVWPATGLALASALLLGYRVWPAIALGAFLANVTSDEPLGTAAGIAAGNTLEAVAGAWLLRRYGGFRVALDRPRDVAALALMGAVGSTALGATIGVTSLCAGGLEPWSRFDTLWWVWWLGDGMGALVVAPVLLVWLGRAAPPRVRGRAPEATVLLLGLLAVAWVVFRGRMGALFPDPALEYAVFPFVMWAALRFGQRGASLVTILTSVVAIGGTLAASGPFVQDTRHESLMLLQVYLAVLAVTGLFLSAAIAERDAAELARGAAAERAEHQLRAEMAAQRETESALRRSEERLRSVADQLELADRRKDEFLAMLGHELRNPLGAVANALELLRRGGASSERVQPILERQVAQLRRLVDDLLDLVRITRGDIPLRRERVDLVEVVSEAVRGTAPRVERSRHRLAVESPPEPVVIEGDPFRLEQVVANLLSNAIKYTPAGGRITVRLGRDGSDAVLAVNDSGIGIGPDLLPHVFEPFTQAERSLDRAQGGLGIGLTLVRKIVGMHGGSVEARSEGLGLGSELVVRLPAAAPALADLPAVQGSERPAAPLHVLLVDDHRDAAASLAELLRMEGHTVDVAPDGPAALVAASVRRPAVVLLDLGLPGMDGFEVARRLRADVGLAEVTIVAITGYGREEDRRRSAESGFDHHLVKPVDLDVLQRLLAAAGSGPAADRGARRRPSAPLDSDDQEGR
jgi:signal transduction histidine kinase/CheY-like chemotaxis protein